VCRNVSMLADHVRRMALGILLRVLMLHWKRRRSAYIYTGLGVFILLSRSVYPCGYSGATMASMSILDRRDTLC
jgi:hypothetical protein